MKRERGGWIAPALTLGAFVLLAWGERRRPLRRRVEPVLPRVAANLVMGTASAAVTAMLNGPVVEGVLRRTEREKLGLLHALPLGDTARVVFGVLLLDYTLWWWHFFNHRNALLWQYHGVHHADRDLDVTTAARVHFGEMALSNFWRAAQVRVLGVDRRALTIWQRTLLVSILFHHSNLRLPERFERALEAFLVTPRMHGIHHSEVPGETDSNWSSLLSWWDWLHGTMKLDVRQEGIVIGRPGGRGLRTED
jgi:sterol desaturase/sphingolipid hydroxylase (fatty acid hydroxylase superfamily)